MKKYYNSYIFTRIATKLRSVLNGTYRMKISEMPALIDSIHIENKFERYIFNDDIDIELPDLKIAGWSFYKYGYNSTTPVKLILPNCTRIDQCAFQYSKNLTAVYFYKAVDVSIYVFRGCSSLETLVLYSTSLCNFDTFSLSGTKLSTGYIYMPRDLIEQYKVSGGEIRNYKSRFRAIEDYPDIIDPTKN